MGTGGDGAINDGVSSAIKATVFDYTNSNPLGVVLRDTNGDYVSVGGGTQYNQGTAATDTDVLTMMGCVRADTAAVATGVIAGDRARCIIDSTGRLWTFSAQSGTWNIGTVTTLTSITNPVAVTGTFWQATQPVSGTLTVIQGTGSNLHVVCDSGCSSSAGFADNSAFTFGTTAVNPIAGVLDDTATNTATENSAAVARITAQKGLHVNLRNNSGTELGTSGSPIRTDPTGSTTQPISAASLPLPTGAATLAEQQTQTTALQLIDNLPLGQGAATAGQSGVLTQGAVTTAAPTYTTGNTNPLSLTTAGALRVDGSGSTQPVSGTVSITTNSAVNVAQINGVAPSMGNGISGTGVQRVTLASDSTGQVAIASLPNEGQQTMGNSVSVAIASDQSNVPVSQATAASLNMRPDTSGATGAAPPARANYVGGLASGATGGFLSGFAVCDSFANVNVSAATTTLLVTGVSGQHVRICSLSLVTAAANNVALISGTGATCATGTTGMTGGTTAATGYNFAANGGITQGNGLGTINQTNATGDSVCIVTSAATQLSGRIAYAIY